MDSKLVLEKVSQRELHEIAVEKGAVRSGATDNVKDRQRKYYWEGFRGTMYYADTMNMMKAEDKLLDICSCRHNIQRLSNVGEEPGFVYVIKGRKLNIAYQREFY